jgi:hypothetical protein
METTLKTNTNRLNIVHLIPTPISYGPKSGIFKPRSPMCRFRPNAL